MTNERTKTTRVFISSIDKTNKYHRAHWIIHNGAFYFAEFNTGKQLDEFLKKLKIMIGQRIKYNESSDAIYQESALQYYDGTVITDIKSYLFWNIEELPKKAKPIRALSNGSLVTCYYLRVKNTLHWFRPNPNSSVFDALTNDEHIAHVKLYGLY